MNYPQFKVTVSCMTYNQSKYITDAMNGFTMQQTSFPFVCTIVDDASTDGEQEVIRKYVEDHFDFSEGSVAYHKETDYAHITYAQHKTNKNCYFAVLYLKENHYSQHKDKSPYLKEWREGVDYMALCEGDDYWINSSKLQKQVDYLDTNLDYSMCFHNAIKLFVEQNTIVQFCPYKEDFDLSDYDAINNWYVPTASMCFRISVMNAKPSDIARIYSGDYTIILWMQIVGKIHCINKYMSVYRINYNNTSATAMYKNKNVFMLSEKIRLLDSFIKYANQDFTLLLLKRIDYLKKELMFQRAKEEKNFLLLLCSYRLIFFKLISKILKR